MPTDETHQKPRWQTDHDPNRETWDCATCGEPWPCEPARTGMLATMRPTELAIYQWQALEDAVIPLQKATGKELWDRFLGWSRREP